MPDHRVDTIVEVSQHNNAKAGISGLLFYNSRNFLQLIEGEKAALDDLMARLSNDSRHSGIAMLEDNRIDNRSCGRWAMQRFDTAENPASRRFSILSQLPIGLSERVQTTILNFAKLN